MNYRLPLIHYYLSSSDTGLSSLIPGGLPASAKSTYNLTPTTMDVTVKSAAMWTADFC